MITVKNYQEQKNNVVWSKMPKAIQDTRNDVEEIMEFYDDDADIKETVDIFLKQINDNSKPVGEIIIAKAPKVDFVEPKQKINREKIDKFKNENPLEIVDLKPKKETIEDAFLNAKYTRAIMPKAQQMAVMQSGKGEEKQFFIDKIKEFEKAFEDAKKRQNISLDDSIVKAHFFYGQTDWYILDYEPSENMFFGYVILNGDVQNAEAGYISIDELHTVKGIELDFYWTQKELGKVLHSRYPDEYPAYKSKSTVIEKVEQNKIKEKSSTKTKAPKSKVKKVMVEKVITEKQLVDNNPLEVLLIRRLYNILKKGENAIIPFNTIKFLYAAFNKAAVERKVRKTSDNADLYNRCNEKVTILFEEFANPSKMDVKIEFSDKKLFKEIEDFATNRKINPSVSLLKRFISMQGTLPEIKRVETLLKSIIKQIDNSNDRLKPELLMAKKELETYLYNPKEKVEVTQYGLSRPRTVCTNRVKCTGIDKTGKLHKGYKFQEVTGHVVKVRKSKLGRTKCVNRVKCTGLTKAGKLIKGYKFEEGTNNVIKVSTTKKKKTQSKLGSIVQTIEHTPMQEIHHNPVVQIIPNNQTIGVTPKPTPINENIENNEDEKFKNPPFEQKPVVEKSRLNNKYKTAYDRINDNMNKNVELFRLNGDLAVFLGKIEKKPVHSLAITLDTEEGGGKTHTIYQWANSFYEAGYNPLIWSLEEHASSSLSITKAEKYFGKNIANIPILSEEAEDTKEETYKKFIESIKDFDVIFIDSWNKLVEINAAIKFDQDVRKKFHGKIFVVIVQRTADGKMRGGSSVGFDGDIILKGVVDRNDFRNNYIYNHKNRYNDFMPISELRYSPYYQGLLETEEEQVIAQEI